MKKLLAIVISTFFLATPSYAFDKAATQPRKEYTPYERTTYGLNKQAERLKINLDKLLAMPETTADQRRQAEGLKKSVEHFAL